MNQIGHTDVLIVGGGLFGQIIARELLYQGREVTILDSQEPNAGSKPAACLMKPSWFSSLGKDVYEPALTLLARHYELKELQFKLGPTKVGGVHWVDPRKVMDLVTEKIKVLSIGDREVVTDQGLYKADLVIVAAGIWSKQFVGGLNLTGRAGVAFTWQTPKCFGFKPFIKPWAPYRQVVAFMRARNELWVGDGSAIKPENWTPNHQNHSLKRCIDALGVEGTNMAELANPLFGIRPYAPKAKPCILEQVTPHLWVATGGAKNGTLAAAWCAHRIAEATC